jgi:hypothetical protein
MIQKAKIFFLLSSVIIAVHGCSPQKKVVTAAPPATTSAVVTYMTDIKPIMETACSGGSKCHNDQKKAGGLALTSYENVKNSVQHKLVCSVRWDGGCDKMPRNGAKLTDPEIQKIEVWVKNGTPE